MRAATTLNRQQLLDDIADERATYQHARRMGNQFGMHEAIKRINAIERVLACHNNVTITKVELA